MRRLALVLLAGCCGAAVVVLPGVASSETGPTIEARGSGGAYGFYWEPMQATVSGGGSVTFSNPSNEVNHGVEWKSGPEAPGCSSAVPAGAGRFGTHWSGTCTFTQPGTYTFWCTVHGEAMKGSVVVNANGTTTTTTTTTATSTPATTAPGGSSTTTATSGFSSAPVAPGTNVSPLAGTPSGALQLTSSQRGSAVRGTVTISPAGAGARLQVDLLANAASLAGAGGAAHARVGKLVRAHLRVGRTAFSVPLNSRARNALQRHGRLRLRVTIVVTPLGASAITIIRGVVVRP